MVSTQTSKTANCQPLAVALDEKSVDTENLNITRQPLVISVNTQANLCKEETALYEILYYKRKNTIELAERVTI